MVNPFKASGKAVSDMFASAEGVDFFDHRVLKAGAVLVTSIVAPVAFVIALFAKDKP